MYIFNAHTNMIHTWLMPAHYSMDIVLTFIPCWGIQKVFFQFFNFSTIFSAIASCITVCDVSQPLPLMFKRFSKTNISFLLRKLDPITFSPALLIKGRLGNLILSNPKKEHGLSNNKLTHRMCIQYSYCQSCKNVQTVRTSRCYFFWPVLIFGKSTRKTANFWEKHAKNC